MRAKRDGAGRDDRGGDGEEKQRMVDETGGCEIGRGEGKYRGRGEISRYCDAQKW